MALPSYGRQIAEKLQEHQWDVVLLQHCTQYAPVIESLNSEAKIALHLHAPWFSESKTRLLSKRPNAVDLVTTVSEIVKSKVVDRFPTLADRCDAMYGIDADEFRRQKDYRRTSRKRRILFVGAVSPHSGVHVLLDAFQRVTSSYPDVCLDIVGPQAVYPMSEVFDLQDKEVLQTVDPFYQEHRTSQLRQMLRILPRPDGYMAKIQRMLTPDVARKVNFVGGIGDRLELINYYYDADIFAFPVLCDHGFGLPPVEAIAAGTAVIASRSGAIPETVNDRQMGLLVAKNDPEGLTAAMLTLLRNDRLREQLGRAARQSVMDRFTWDGVAERMYERYQRLCATGTRKRAIRNPWSYAAM
jgi:glycosyltransferase involved in cell wall biosynthesis